MNHSSLRFPLHLKESGHTVRMLARLLSLLFALCLCVPQVLLAQPRASLTVLVRDSTSRESVADGLIALRSADVNRTERAQGSAGAQFSALSAGAYTITVTRIGYRPRVVSVLIAGRDTTIAVSVEALPTELAKFQVRAKTQDIFGTVGAMPGPHAVVGARVQIGIGQPTLKTDSAGKFIFRNLKPGVYTLRIVADGFNDRVQMIVLPEGTAYEASHLLDAGKGGGNARAFQWGLMEQRIRNRGFNSAIVSSEELKDFPGTSLTNAIARTQEVAAKGLLPPTAGACVALNGRPMPGFRVDNFEIEEVAFVEVYDRSGLAARQAKPGEERCRRTVFIWTKK